MGQTKALFCSDIVLSDRLLDQQVMRYREFDTLIETKILKLIDDQRENPYLTLELVIELELLFRSALSAGYQVAYWARRAREADVKIDLIALEGLGNGEFLKRASAVIALGHLGESFIEPIVGMLDDPYPQVRIAAIAALEHLQPTGEWRTHLKYECYIPSGIFIMGGQNEAHEVLVDAFYVSKYPVTNAEYKRYMEAYGREFLVPQDKDTHPVINVSWYDA